MKRYERIISIIMLTVISLSNVATPVAYAAPLAKIHLHFQGDPVFDKSGLTKVPKFNISDQGSVLGASTTLFTIGTQKLDLDTGNQGSAGRRIPIQVGQLDKKVYATTEDVALTVVNPDNEPFTTSVSDINGKAVSVPITESNSGTTTTVDLAPSNQIRPGLYKVTITDAEKKSTEQDFTWGVLALNTDKSIYYPGEKADIAMAVLNNNGDMVCNANVKLNITDGSGNVTELSTQETGDSQIIVNPQCQKHDFSLEPDYEAHYTFGSAGMYSMQLTATTSQGSHTITDSIQVKDQVPFDVQRISATRIYPPNTYPMLLNITANRDFSGTVTETVPDSFIITPATQSAAQSYSAMQTVYLNSNDPAAAMSQQIATASGGLVMPFHGSYPITQGFGAQLTDPTLQAFYTHYGLGGHDGIDFGLPMNTPLYAVDDGTVIWSGPGDYGTMVTILHSWGQTYYGHMSNTSVTVGQQVSKGQLIGYSGMTGEATGPHLHFGMKPKNPDMENGYYGKIDPMPFLPIGQGEPIAALGADTNPVSNLVYNSTVLGASDSAATPTPSNIPTATPTPSGIPSVTPTTAPTVQPTAALTPTTGPTGLPTPSEETQTVTATPMPTTAPVQSVFAQPTKADNTTFSVLDREIKLNEEIANSTLTQKVKVITWKVSLKKGESTSLGYAYQTPRVSPQFYLLGPAKFYDGSNDRLVFQEQRQWQIASDDVGVDWYSNTTGNKWNGYSWLYRKKLDIDHTKVTSNAGSGTVTFDNSASTVNPTVNGSNTNQATWSQTVGNNCVNPLLVVMVATYNNDTITVTDNSVNMTHLTTSFNVTANNSEIFYMVDPSTSNSLVVNVSPNDDIVAGSMSFCGVNQTTPFGTPASAATGVNTPAASGSMTVTAGQMLVDSFAFLGGAGPWAPGGSQTQVWSTDPYNNGGGASYEPVTSSGSVTMSWSLSGSTDTWAEAAAPINPAGSSSGTTPTFIDSGGDSTGDLSFWSGPNNWGTNAVDGTKSETGPDSLKITYNAGVPGDSLSAPTGSINSTAGRISFYFNLATIPTQVDSLLNFYTGTTFDGTPIEVTGLGQLQCTDGVTHGSTTLSANKWYRTSIGYAISGTTINYKIYLNGNLEVTCNSMTLSSTSPNDFSFGADAPSQTINIDDVYADNGSDKSDPGDIHVTNKRPFANGSYNDFSTQIGSGGSGYGSGHAPQVNERPLSTTNGWQSTGTYTPALDTSATFDEGSNIGATWTTGSFTVNTGHTDDYLLVGIIDRNSFGTIPSITYGGQAMSYIGEGNTGTTTGNYFLFGLNAPPTGANTFTVNRGTSSSWYTMIAESWYHVNQTTPYGSFATTAGTSGTVSVTVSSTVSGRVGVDFIWSAATGLSPSAGQTSIQNTNVAGGGGMIASSYKSVTSTSVTLSWGSSGWWGSKAVDLIGSPIREEYTVEGAAQGDVDISSSFPIGQEAWAYAESAGTCTNPTLINQGNATAVSLSSSAYGLFTSLSNNFSYPSGNTDVGMTACTNGSSSNYVKLAEAGMQIAYQATDPTALTNFPVLINLASDNDLKGSHTQNNGGDILFTDSTGRNLLPFEIESYTNSTGSLQAWVKISSLSPSVDTIIYMYYGNPSAASLANASGTWDSNYKGVWHLPNGSTLSLTDSTSANTSTNHGATATTGEIGGGALFNGSSQYVDLGSAMNPGATNTWTVELWYKSTNRGVDQALVEAGNQTVNGYEVSFNENPCAQSAPYNYKVSKFGVADICVGTVPNDSNYHALAIVYSTTGVTAYVDGAQSGATSTNSSNMISATKDTDIGSVQGAGSWFPGSEDEVRFSNISRNSSWIKTEYTNESNPGVGGFLSSLGSQETDIYAPTLSQLMRHGQFFNSQGQLQPFVF